MSFMVEFFIVFLGSFPAFILRRACLILNTVPPWMSPCGSLYAVKCRLHSLWRSLPHSLHSPSLRMSSSLAALCSPPRSLLLSVDDWRGDRGEEQLFLPRDKQLIVPKDEKTSLSLPFTSISPCLISLLPYKVISLKIVSFLSKFDKTYQTVLSFTL